MPLTSIQALEAVKENGFVVEEIESGLWRAQTREHTRLHRGGAKPSYEEAVEAALLTLEENEKAKARADKSRLFDLLGSGAISKFERREETVTEPGEPAGRVPRFDLFDRTGKKIVTGNASLHGAVVEAEEAGVFK